MLKTASFLIFNIILPSAVKRHVCINKLPTGILLVKFKFIEKPLIQNIHFNVLLRKIPLNTFLHSFTFTLTSFSAQAQSDQWLPLRTSNPPRRHSSLTDRPVAVCSCRVAEKEPINKMSLHNLATVFGPTLLRPSESESLKGQHITSASDIWSHDVMAQVPPQNCVKFLYRIKTKFVIHTIVAKLRQFNPFFLTFCNVQMALRTT